MQRWAYAADALDELCPGASTCGYWVSAAARATTTVLGERARRASSDGDTASGGDTSPPLLVVSATGSADSSAEDGSAESINRFAPAPPLATADTAFGLKIVASRSDCRLSPSSSLPLAASAVVPGAAGAGAAPQPLLPASHERIAAVARELQDYRDSLAKARLRAKSDGVAGGALRGGRSLGECTQSLPFAPVTPPESLLDDLLNEVLQLLGDS